MIRPFHGSFPLTQGFGENPDIYKQFGMAGHNGLDYGLPTGTELISPIAGKVTEIGNEGETGYGNYVKIENDQEGHLLAHMQTVDVVAGQEVGEGQHVGVSDNTGFSTGDHLHWGYFSKPRDRANGYAGYVDQAGLIQTASNSTTIPVEKKQFEALVTKSGRFDEVCRYLEIAGEPIDTPFEAIQSVIAGYKSRVTDLNNQVVAEQTERKNREEQVSRLKDQVSSLEQSTGAIQKKIAEITKVYEGQVKKLQDQVDTMGKDKGKLNSTISTLQIDKQKLQNQVDSLSKQAVAGMDAKTLAKYLLKKLVGKGVSK